MALFKFRVVLCRIRVFPTLISKIKWLGSGLPLRKVALDEAKEKIRTEKVGHQEAILDAILLLDDTVREIRFGSLKSTAKKLFEKCLKLQNLRNPMQNDRPIGGHGFPLDTINSSQLSNKVCLIKIQMDQLTWISHS